MSGAWLSGHAPSLGVREEGKAPFTGDLKLDQKHPLKRKLPYSCGGGQGKCQIFAITDRKLTSSSTA